MAQLIDTIKKDLYNHGGKGILSSLMVFFFDARFRLLLNYRLGHVFVRKNNRLFRLLAKYYKYKQITRRNCQISYKAILGENVKFLHPLGVVIGDRVVVGNNVMIWQQVTLGSHGRGKEMAYPIIQSNVRIFAGAKIIGNITIGDSAVIAANAFVNTSVLDGDIVGGIPAVSLKRR